MRKNLIALIAMSAVMGEAAATGGGMNQATPEATKAPEIPVGQRTAQPFSFFFRTDKLRDNEGKVLGNGRKHPDVKAVLPVPTYAQMIEFLQQGGKEAELMFDALVTEIDRAARNQINDFREDKGLDVDWKADMFDLSKLSVTAIANTPRGERGGPTISDEDWTAFLADYKHVMVDIVGYEEKKVDLAIMHLKVQLRRIKNDKAAVAKLLELLNLYATKTESMEDHAGAWQELTKKAQKYLTAEEKNVSEAL